MLRRDPLILLLHRIDIKTIYAFLRDQKAIIYDRIFTLNAWGVMARILNVETPPLYYFYIHNNGYLFMRYLRGI
jgi:hypothetical protein